MGQCAAILAVTERRRRIKDPQFAQPLDETYQFSDLSSLKFSDVLRETGCKAVQP